MAAIVAAGGEPSGLAAKSATATIPIVFGITGELVAKAGFDLSLNLRPLNRPTLIVAVMALIPSRANTRRPVRRQKTLS
jgi:hypothetical protein